MTEAAPALTMVDGTDNNKDYLLLALKGPIALAVKPLVVASNGKGQVYIGCKLRSMLSKDIAAKIPLPAVLNLSDAKATLLNAWGEVEWEKTSDTYCSVPIGTWMKGDAAKPDELCKNLREVVPGNLTEFLWGLAEKNAVITQDQLLGYVTKVFGNLADEIEHKVANHKLVKELAEKHGGVFAFQTAKLKAQAKPKASDTAPSNGTDNPQNDD